MSSNHILFLACSSFLWALSALSMFAFDSNNALVNEPSCALVAAAFVGVCGKRSCWLWHWLFQQGTGSVWLKF